MHMFPDVLTPLLFLVYMSQCSRHEGSSISGGVSGSLPVTPAKAVVQHKC